MSSNKSSSKKRKNEINSNATHNILSVTTNNNNNEKQTKKLKSTFSESSTTKTITSPPTQPQPQQTQNNKINIKEINNIFNNTNNNNTVSADSWDGTTPIENLTIGQLISSLNGRQHNLRIIVAEYMNSLNRLIGFTEKTPYLLNWVLDNLSKSFINWKQPEKSEQLIQKGIEPLFFEERYWTLLESLVTKQISLQHQQQQQQQQNDTTNNSALTSNSSNSIKLSNEYLQFIFEIILNSIRNIDLKLDIFNSTNLQQPMIISKKKKNINIPYQLTTSPPPPIKLLEFSKRISTLLIKIFSSDELMKEIPLLLENLIPLSIKYLRNSKYLLLKNESTIISIIDLYQTLFQYLLVQTKLGINYKSMFTTTLSTLLPHIITLLNTLENISSIIPTSSQLIETIDQFLKWTLYHPESHWDSYSFILFSDWLKKIVKDTTSKEKGKENEKSKLKSKENEKEKEKQKQKEKQKENEKEKEKEKEDLQIYQPQLILDSLLQIINGNNEVLNRVVCFNEKDTVSSILVNSLYKFLIYFIEQYESFGYRHFKDIVQWYDGANHKDEKFIEFAYFRKLFSLINTPTLLSNNPTYYESVAKLLNQVSILNIFHISNRHQVDYLSNTVANSFYLYLSASSKTNNNQNNQNNQIKQEIILNGIYKCLTSIIKISNTLIGNKLKDIILPHIWSNNISTSTPTTTATTTITTKDGDDDDNESLLFNNGRCEFLKSTFDSYFEIRQMDTLLTMVFQSIISVRSFGSDSKFSINQDFLKHISKLFSNLPFGQVPIIWSLFLEEWQGYYITQLNESNNKSLGDDNDQSMLDPMFSYRLEYFIKLWSTFLDGITISSFVYKMILQLLPNTFQSIVDPILNEIYKSSSSTTSSSSSSKKSSKSSSKSSSSKSNNNNNNNNSIINLLKLYSSFLQVHSFIHRQTIISGKSGENEFGYHPQQFYYYQLCEKELEFSKVIEYLINNNNFENNYSNKLIASKLLIQRVQQLHSILSSVSIANYKRNINNNNNISNNNNNNNNYINQKSNNSKNIENDKIKYISSYSNQQYSPKDIEYELIDIVYYLLNNFIKLINDNNLLFKKFNILKQQQIQDKLEQQQDNNNNNNNKDEENEDKEKKLNLLIYQSKLLIDNISTWCEYSTIENIQNILKFIISPPIEINNDNNNNCKLKTTNSITTTTTSIYKEFQKLLTNPLFFELKVFQNNFPIVLCQMERDIITKELIKSNKLFEKVTEIFNDVQERLINSGSLTPSNTSYAEIIIEIQECFSKKITLKDFNLSDTSKWERLTWLVSLAPSFHPLYIPIELIGPLVLSSIAINHIGVLLLKQIQDTSTIDNNNNNEKDLDYIYKLILSSRRFIKFCFEKDQSRLVQIIPMNVWIDLIFSSRMFESIDTKYPILFTSLEIQHHYNTELWKHSPMELKKLSDKILNKKSNNNSAATTTITTSPKIISTNLDFNTIKPYLIAGILKSISTTNSNNQMLSDILPPDLQSIIKSVEPDISIFYEKMFNHCSSNPTFNNIAPFFNEYQAEFSLLVYHLWYQLYFNAIDNESLSKLLITVSFSGVFISGLSSKGSGLINSVDKYSLILQNSIISLLDLFSRWYSKIPANQSQTSSSSSSPMMIDSLHALSLLSKMLSLYPEDSKLYKSISAAIIQFFQLNNQLGYLLNSITTTMESSSTLSSSSTNSIAIQSQSFNLLGYFISSIIGTKRINLLKNPIKLVTAIVNILNQTNSESLIVSGINLLCKLMSVNVIDVHGESIPIILSVMSFFSSPFIYSTPVRSIASFSTEIIPNCPMSLFIKEKLSADNNINNNSSSSSSGSNGLKFNNITPLILNSLYKLLYIILKFRNNELTKYLPSFVSSLRFLLYSVANETNKLGNEKSIKKVGRLLELFSLSKNCDQYFQYLIVDYVQLIRYSTTAINNANINNNNNNNNNSNNNSNKRQYVGPQYHLSTEMRNLLLPGVFSLIQQTNNSSKELFNALEDTGKGIFQNIISQYQSYKYTGK
ncbi:hypothetical protein ACTFIR_011179 [Dictyostelium discoideum]